MVLFFYTLMCIIFGTTFLAIKVGVDAGAPPFLSAGLRFFLAGLILFIVMVGKRRAKLSLLLHKEMFLTSLGLTFGTFSTLYWAEQYVESGLAAVISATGPLMILLIQWITFRQKISFKAAIGCMIGFLGLLLIILPSVTAKVSLVWVLGCLAILVGEFCYASGAVYSKSVIQRFPETSPIALNAAQMMYGGILLLLLSLFTENVHVEALLSFHAINSLLYLTIVGSMMGHSIFYWLVAKTNPILPSTWLYISPLIALCIGVLWYNEVFSFLAVIGGITIIVGIVIVNFDSLSQQWTAKRTVMGKNEII